MSTTKMTERHENLAQMAVIMNENRVLALQFQNYEELDVENKWVLPGGRPDVGEHVHEALKREVLEETGLEIENIEPLHINNFQNVDGRERIRISYVCKPKELKDVQLSHEHKDHKWITKEDVEELDWIDPDFKKVVKKAFARE